MRRADMLERGDPFSTSYCHAGAPTEPSVRISLNGAAR
jgi:hypothetical protein